MDCFFGGFFSDDKTERSMRSWLIMMMITIVRESEIAIKKGMGKIPRIIKNGI